MHGGHCSYSEVTDTWTSGMINEHAVLMTTLKIKPCDTP